MCVSLQQLQPEPKAHRYVGEVHYCAVCDGSIEVDAIEWVGRYQYVQTLGYVCDATNDCKHEQALEVLRMGA